MNNLLCMLCLSICFLSTTNTDAQKPEYGEASFYDDSFQGKETAYGVKYDKNDLTTAHKIHPYGTILKVTRLDNKKSVNVKVIDKGPYIKGRIVDLSKRAAQVLGFVEDGTANVKVEVVKKGMPDAVAEKTVITPENKESTTAKRPSDFDTSTPTPTNKAKPVSNTAATEKKTSNTTTTAAATDKKEKAKPTATTRIVKQDYAQYGLYKIQLERPLKKGFGVQVSSLTNYENVLKQVADLQAKSFDNILISVEKGKDNKPIYKIILGPQDTESQANTYKSNLKKRYKINGFVISLEALSY